MTRAFFHPAAQRELQEAVDRYNADEQRLGTEFELRSLLPAESLCRSAAQLDKLEKSSRKRPHSISYLHECVPLIAGICT